MSRPKRVLVACEFSGIVRDAFLVEGHDAISCDLLPTESPGPHIQSDVLPLLRESWDLVIAHPPCTYLCQSGVRWLYEKPGRMAEMKEACRFFRHFLLCAAGRVAVENPVMHGHALRRIGQRHSFTIQPYQFGHPESKRTCFWTKGLPPLLPTQMAPKSSEHRRLHNLAPGPERARERSRTFSGVARAMAVQWGTL